MTRRWPEARAIDWNRLPGAYGVDRDVAGALETLRFARNADSDAFSDAWHDVLLGHVWHQGSIYPVTAHVLPFVFDVVDCSPALSDPSTPARQEIAALVLMMASSARRAAQSSASDERAAGEGVLRALAAHEGRLRAWMEKDLRSLAIAAMLHLPELGARLLEGEGEASTGDVLTAVLEHSMWLEGAAVEWAAREVARIDHPVTQRASQLLSAPRTSRGRAAADRLAALAGVLAQPGDPALRLEELREAFGCALPTRFVREGATEGEVVTVDDDWFVVRAERNVTVRWKAHPFVEGDRVVLLDIDERNLPRGVRGTGAKAGLEATFDDRGSRIPPP